MATDSVEDREYYHEDSLESFEKRMKQLRLKGYIIPSSVFERINKEKRER